MKVKVLREVEVDAKTINVCTKVRYWEDAKVNGVDDIEFHETKGEGKPMMPCAMQDSEKPSGCIYSDHWSWCPKIDIETGKITNWAIGTTANIHYKVCDEFACLVMDTKCEIIKEYEGYVPSFMCPKEEGYGDYIIMDINEDGFIEDWNKWDVVDFLTRN